jgi:polysaccharide export outer membrane protein
MPPTDVDAVRDLTEDDFIMDDYRLDYGDRLRISVWPQKRYSKKVTVNLDGEIFYPPMGKIFVLDKSMVEFKEIIEQGLHRYLIDPLIEVKILKSLGRRVYIFGQVKNPGIFNYGMRYKRMLPILAKAKGPRSTADLKHVLLIRDVQTNPTYTYLNLKDCFLGISFKDNVVVLPGDFIYIPRTKLGDAEAFVRHAALFVRFAFWAQRTVILGPRTGNVFIDLFGGEDIFQGGFEE